MRCTVDNQLAFMGLDRWRGPNGFPACPNGRRLSLQVALLRAGCLGGWRPHLHSAALGSPLPHFHRARLAHPGCITTKTRTGLDVGLRGYAGYSWVLLGTLQRRRLEDVQVRPDEEPCDRRGEASFSSRTHTRPHARTHASTHTHTNTRVPPTVWSGVPHRG